jgi:predicted permease
MEGEPLLASIRTELRPWLLNRALAASVVVEVGGALALVLVLAAVLDTVDRQALVFPHGARLLRPILTGGVSGSRPDTLPAPGFAIWRANTSLFESISAYYRVDTPVHVDGQGAFRLPVARISGELFATLGVPTVAGRPLRIEDESALPCAVVVTRRLASQVFGGATAALTRRVDLDSQACVVVGVVADQYAFPSSDIDLFAPFRPGVVFTRDLSSRTSVRIAQVQVIGRQKAGVSPEALANEATHYFEAPARIVPFAETITATYRRIIEVLAWCSLLVLVVAVLNVASTLATQALNRVDEWGIKGALGASPGRLWLEVTRENAGILLGAGGVGVGLGMAGLSLARRVGPEELVNASPSEATYVSFCLLLFCLMLLAPIPAWWRASQASGLRVWSAGTVGITRSGRALGALLLVGQLVGATMLVTVALVFASTLRSTLVAPRGFDADDVLAVSTFRGSGEAMFDYVGLVDVARRALGASGVGVRAAIANDLPVSVASRPFSIARDLQQRGLIAYGTRGPARLAAISPDYFAVMGTKVLSGREFHEDDGQGNESVVVVSESLAQRWFASVAGAIGHTIDVPWGRNAGKIVGVVQDVRRNLWDAGELPVIYLHYRQIASVRSDLNLILLTKGVVSERVLRAKLDRAVPRLVIGPSLTIRRARRLEVTQTTLYLAVAGAFATLTVLLMAAGVFTTTSSTFTRRASEFALRQGLGATPYQAARETFEPVARLLVISGILAVGASLASASVVATMQAGLAPVTLRLVAVAVALVGAAALAGALSPIRRAVRQSPGRLLRRDG